MWQVQSCILPITKCSTKCNSDHAPLTQCNTDCTVLNMCGKNNTNDTNSAKLEDKLDSLSMPLPRETRNYITIASSDLVSVHVGTMYACRSR